MGLSQRDSIEHVVKSWTFLFEPMMRGDKSHDIRVMDRDYRIGDTLLMQEYDWGAKIYTGREVRREITYITSAECPCAFSHTVLHPQFCVLSVRPVAS